ncbi:hypothetical protein ACXO82_07380 [Lactobacillus delbrueckii subsp. bulgaricus]|nr:hypothetical protein [Lactobacillus delbrueckii]
MFNLFLQLASGIKNADAIVAGKKKASTLGIKPWASTSWLSA